MHHLWFFYVYVAFCTLDKLRPTYVLVLCIEVEIAYNFTNSHLTAVMQNNRGFCLLLIYSCRISSATNSFAYRKFHGVIKQGKNLKANHAAATDCN